MATNMGLTAKIDPEDSDDVADFGSFSLHRHDVRPSI